MSIRSEIAELFRVASAAPENNRCGLTDWDFVDADIMMDLGVDRIIEGMVSLEEFYPYFNGLVDLHILAERA